MKLIFVSLLTLLCLTAFTRAQDKTIHRDDPNRFLVAYSPEKWEISQSVLSETKLRLSFKKHDGKMDFGVSVKKMSRKLNANEILEIYNDPNSRKKFFESAIKATGEAGKLVTSGKTYIANQEAVFVVMDVKFRVLDTTLDLRVFQTMQVFNGDLYLLMFRCPPDLYESQFSEFRELASGFMLLTSPATK